MVHESEEADIDAFAMPALGSGHRCPVTEVGDGAPEAAAVGGPAVGEAHGADGVRALTYDRGGSGTSRLRDPQPSLGPVRTVAGPVLGLHPVHAHS